MKAYHPLDSRQSPPQLIVSRRQYRFLVAAAKKVVETYLDWPEDDADSEVRYDLLACYVAALNAALEEDIEQ